MPKITYPKITLSPAIIHSLCYAWVHTTQASLSIKQLRTIDLVRGIADQTDFRDLTQYHITRFCEALAKGYIELT